MSIHQLMLQLFATKGRACGNFNQYIEAEALCDSKDKLAADHLLDEPLCNWATCYSAGQAALN